MPQSAEMTAASDEQIITSTLRGDIASFGTLAERYWNMVVALALSRISDAAEAEDIAQESFLKAYSQLSSLQQRSRFAGWLSKIVLQQCSNAIRRNVRAKTALGSKAMSIDDLGEQLAEMPNPGLTRGQIDFVRQTVQRMPEKFRTPVVMRFVAGLSAAQIAEQLGKRPGAIRIRLHRAYKILRRDLAPLLGEVESL